MKFFLVFALIALLFSGVVICHEYCDTDAECDPDECCVKSYFPGRRSKVCKDMGDDVGDRCGGEYQCSNCNKGLQCVQDKKSLWNKLRKGTGSCQRSNRRYSSFNNFN